MALHQWRMAMECEGIPAVPKTPQRPRSNPPSKSVRGRKAAQALEAHRLGKALLKNQKLPEALASFDRAIALLQHNNPRHSFHFHFSRALCLQKMCRLGPAVDDLSRCLFIRRTALCLSLRGTWLVTLGHQTVALNDFNEAALLQNTPHHNQQKGNLLKELGRDAEAVEAFTQALARGSGELRIQCLHARGVCLWKLGRAHDASRDLREVADAGCGSVQLQIDLARALHAAGDPTAEQAFSRVITERGGGADVADSAVIEAYIGRASLRFDDINRDKETLSDYTAAIDMKERLEGSVPPLWYLRRAHVTSRIAAAHGGDLAVALEDCHRAESLDPNNISVHKTIASLLSRLERHEEALRHFTRVVELLLCTAPPAESPELAATRIKDVAEYQYQAAVCLHKLDRNVEALKLVQASEKGGGEGCIASARTFLLQGLVSQSLHEYAGAVQAFTAAMAIDRTRCDTFLYRGRNLAQLGRHAEAFRSLSQSISMAKSTGGSEDDNTSVLMAAYEARGQACRQLGKWHDAANDFLGAINSGSVAWTLHWWRAFSLVRSGQIPEAEKSLANCEKFARDQTQPSLFWRILYQIALIYLGLAWTEEGADCVYEASAARYLQAAAEMPALSDIVPGSADGKVMAALKYQHGVQMARVCSFAEAAEHLEQAEQMMGQFESRDIRLQCGILLERGTAYIMCDRHLDAVRDFSSVLKLDESNIRAFHGRGWAHKVGGALQAAASDFEETLRLCPDDDDLRVDYMNCWSVDAKNVVMRANKCAPYSPEVEWDIKSFVDVR